MSIRKISTRIAIDGEAEFKAAVTSINSELRKMSSELKLVEAEYKGNANTAEALEKKLKALQDMQEAQTKKTEELKKATENAKKAQEAYANKIDEIKSKLAAVQSEMDELSKSTDDTSEQMAALTEEQAKLSSELDTAQGKYDAATRGVNNWEAQLNRSKATSAELNREIEDTSGYLDEAKNSADGCAKSIDEFGKKTKEAGEKGSTAINTLAEAIVATGLAKGIKEIADAMTDCVEASMEFESAIAGVYKTVEGTPEQLQRITDGIKQMSLEMPATTTEIAGVAEAAGQLGIATDNILSFTETMINLGVATNMTAEDAATSLARFANITGMGADNYGRLGSTIVALGNSFATTESQITEMSTRLASAGRMAGMSEPEILALSTAMASVGIEAEAGGTAMTQTLNAISKLVSKGGSDLETLAGVAGMSAAEFAAAWQGDPMTALSAFIAGVGQLSFNGESAVMILDELGMSGVRQSNMIRSLSLANDLFTGSVNLANQAWKENVALTEEVGKRYATTKSKVQLTKNALEGLKIAIGDELNPVLDKLSTAGKDALETATQFIEENPWVVKALFGIATAAGTVTVAFLGWEAVTKILPALTKAVMAFNAALASNPAGLIAVAISSLVAAIAALALTAEYSSDTYQDFIDKVEESREAYQETVDALSEQKTSTEDLVTQITALAKVENKSAVQKQQMIELTKQLNDAVPGLALEYDSLTDSLNMTVEAMMELIKTQQEQDELVEKAKRAIELEKQIAEAKERTADAEKELTAARKATEGIEDKRSRGNRNREREENARTTRVKLARDAYEALQAQLESLEAEYEELTGAAESASGAIADSASDAAIRENIGTLIAELKELSTAYDDAYNSAYESLSSQIGMFEEVGDVATRSIEDVMAAFDSQIEYFTDYADNLAKAMEMGLDEGLIKQLSDGSKESAAILQGLVNAGEDKIKELNEKFKAVQESKQTLAETMAEAEIDFRNKCNEIVADAEAMVNGLDLSAVAAQAGTNTGQAYISALMDALRTYISISMPDVEYPTRSTNASGAVVSSDRRTKSNTYNTTINVTSPTRLSPSEIARAEKKALRLVAQNER